MIEEGNADRTQRIADDGRQERADKADDQPFGQQHLGDLPAIDADGPEDGNFSPLACT